MLKLKLARHKRGMCYSTFKNYLEYEFERIIQSMNLNYTLNIISVNELYILQWQISCYVFIIRFKINGVIYSNPKLHTLNRRLEQHVKCILLKLYIYQHTKLSGKKCLLAAKSDDLSSSPGPTRQKERTDSELSCGHHICTMHICKPSPGAH